MAHQAGAYPGFRSMKRLRVFLLPPLDGMLVHRRVTPPPPTSIKFASTHLYTWVERGTVRVKFLAQEQNTMSPARARTRSSGVERANHEATVPPTYHNITYNQNITAMYLCQDHPVSTLRASPETPTTS